MFVDIIKKSYKWLFPQKCIVCGCETDEDSILCYECFSKVTFIGNSCCSCCGKLLDTEFGSDALCESCYKEKKFFDQGKSLFLYDFNTKPILMKIKNNENEYIAFECATLILLKYKDFILDTDIIIPVPSHWLRILKRGYNPASLVAKGIAIKSNQFPKFKEKVLIRIRNTKYQKNKNRIERVENVKKAFFVYKPNFIKGKKILLVDDAMTTGATLNECARTLKHAGASYVKFITIATTKIF